MEAVHGKEFQERDKQSIITTEFSQYQKVLESSKSHS